VSDKVTFSGTGPPAKVGEWAYALHLAAAMDSGPRIVAKHVVVRELPNGEMEQKGPYVSQQAAELIAKALNISVRMAEQLR
jgi:hypothetical protein